MRLKFATQAYAGTAAWVRIKRALPASKFLNVPPALPASKPWNVPCGLLISRRRSGFSLVAEALHAEERAPTPFFLIVDSANGASRDTLGSDMS